MKNQLCRWTVLAAACVAGVVGFSAMTGVSPVSIAYADEAATKLPAGEEVLDNFIKATGGKAAYESVKNRTSTGSVDIPAAGLKGTVVTTQAEPNLARISMELPGVGKTEQGTDGETVWEKNPVTGVRILDSAERDMMLRQFQFNAELNWKTAYKSAETVGIEDVGGKPAYKVKMIANDGSVVFNYYDKASSLLVKSESVFKSQMGELPISVIVSDYKEVDGIKMPMLATQTMQGMEMKLVTEKVEHNTTLAADAFALPDDVKALKAKSPATQPK
jgi:hypothetical protein